MLKLITADLDDDTQRRLTRMTLDIRLTMRMSEPEIRAAYSLLEAMRDRLSELLDRVDGKHV